MEEFKNINDFELCITKDCYKYTGNPIIPEFHFNDGLTENYYDCEFHHNINVGTACVEIYGKNGIIGHRRFQFNIEPVNIEDTRCVIAYNETSYSGSEQKPPVSVFLGDKLLNRYDYRVNYEDNISCGSAKVVICGFENVVSQKTLSFDITNLELSDMRISGVNERYSYTGKDIIPELSIVYMPKEFIYYQNPFTLVEGTDFSIRRKNKKKIGKSQIELKGINNFKGTVNLSFRIVDNALSITTSDGCVHRFDLNLQSGSIGLVDISGNMCEKYSSEISDFMEIIGVESEDDIQILPHCFHGLRNLQYVRFPNVKILRNNCFDGCTRLSSIDIDWDELYVIESNVFKDCKSISSVSSDSVKYVEESAFCGCDNLTIAEFHNAEMIHENAFVDCPKLQVSVNL